MQYQELGDYIGAESCIDFKTDVADVISHGGAGTDRHRCQRRRDGAEREYPPAIPSLVMKKYSTSDGRLVIREEKVKRRREYFQAHRSNGRLLLSLVPFDDAVEEICSEGSAGDNGEESFDLPDNAEVSLEEINGGSAWMDDPTADEVHSGSSKYNGIGVNPCGGCVVEVAVAVAVAVAEFRPPVLT